MRKIFGKLIRGVLIGIFSVLLFLNIWQFISHTVFHQNPPSFCGYSPVIVLSGSMKPAFSAGDLLIIRKQDSYQKDEIVTFEDSGALTTHRIIGQTPEGFTTKGDYNNAPDKETVSPEQIKGALVLLVPRVGSFFLFLRSPLVLLLLLAAGLALLFLPDWIRNWISHRKGCAD